MYLNTLTLYVKYAIIWVQTNKQKGFKMAKEIRENEEHEELKKELIRILEEMEESKSVADIRKNYVSVYHIGLDAKRLYEEGK